MRGWHCATMMRDQISVKDQDASVKVGFGRIPTLPWLNPISASITESLKLAESVARMGKPV